MSATVPAACRPRRPVPASPGRPALAVGLDVGGTKIAAGLVRCTTSSAIDTGSERQQQPEVLARRQAATPAGADAILDTCAALVDELRELAKTQGGQQLSAVGAGLPGVIDPARGTVLAAGSTVPGWAGTPAAAELGRRTGLPVRVDNDVRMAAVGELAAGAGRGQRRVLLLSLGTGVGGAVVLDGTLQTGAVGTAGELAHLAVTEPGVIRCGCGSRWHLEAVASGPAIAAEYARRTGSMAARTDAGAAGPGAPVPGSGIDLRAVGTALAAGDPVAAQVVSRAATLAGAAIAGLVTVLDVDTLILAGGAWQVGQQLRKDFALAVAAGSWPADRRLSMVPAALGTAAPIVGAAVTALREPPRAQRAPETSRQGNDR